VWRETLAPEDWNPHSDVVKWHDRTAKGHETFHGFVKLHYPESKTLEDWVYYSQLNQRDALRHGVEHYRRSPFCAGSLIWQLNDCWPVQSWSILDSNGTYKALAYELRRLYADDLVSIERDNETVRVWTVGDVEFPSLSAHHLVTGELLRHWRGKPLSEVGVTPDGQPIRVALEVDVSGLATPDILLIAAGGLLDTWRLLAEPKNARLASPAPITVDTSDDGWLNLILEAPVVDLMLTSNGDPTPFAENFITTVDQRVLVKCHVVPKTIEARSLSGIHPVRIVRGPI
jgi:beta-mannosidase